MNLMMRCVTAGLILTCLAACNTTSGPTPNGPVFDIGPLPTSTAAPCYRPVPLGSSNLSERQAEQAWAEDRTHLIECAARHGAAVSSYNALANSLNGASRK